MLKYLNVKTMKKGLSSTTFPKRNGAGFTLLETIIAIFIITIGIVGVSSLVSQTIGSVTISSQRLIAAYLAQEGIEIVRNIRDTNWLEDVAWDEGLGVGDWEGDYTDTQSFFYPCSPIPFTCPTRGFPLHSLKINGGFYNYSSGTDTEFQRRITIFDKTADMFKVSVSVGWRAKGKTYQIEAQENLYNWR